MKKILIAFLIFLSFSMQTFAKSVNVDVNGLVCEFCASTIEKVFEKKPEVESVQVDLNTKKVVINFLPNKNLSDEEIFEVIKNNGYNVVKINR